MQKQKAPLLNNTAGVVYAISLCLLREPLESQIEA